MRHHAHALNRPVAPAVRSASGQTGLSAIAADARVSTPNVASIHADVRSGGIARHQPARAAPWCTSTIVAMAGGNAAKNSHEIGMTARANSRIVHGSSATRATAVKITARRNDTNSGGQIGRAHV